MTESRGPEQLQDDSFDDPDLLPRAPSRQWGRKLGQLIPMVGVAMCCYFLAQARDDLVYLFRSDTPVDLGQPGSYHFAAAKHGIYATVRGEVHSEGAHYQEGYRSGAVWPLKGAPLVIKRADFTELRGEVQADGMLLEDDRLKQRGEYNKVLSTFLRRNQIGVPGPEVGTAHVWVLIEGHRPHTADLTNGWIVLLLALFALNTWWLIKPMVRR